MSDPVRRYIRSKDRKARLHAASEDMLKLLERMVAAEEENDSMLRSNLLHVQCIEAESIIRRIKEGT